MDPLASFPALKEVHNSLLMRSASLSANTAPAQPQPLQYQHVAASRGSTYDMVQTILSRGGGGAATLAAVETAPPVTSFTCDGCTVLKAQVAQLQATVKTLTETVNALIRGVSTLGHGETTDDSVSGMGKQSGRKDVPLNEQAANGLKPTEIDIASLTEVRSACESLEQHMVRVASNVVPPKAVESLVSAAERMCSLESDLETTVSEMSKMESALIAQIRDVEKRNLSRSDAPSVIAEWHRKQRNDALEACLLLYRFFGLPADAVEEAVKTRSWELTEKVVAESTLARCLAICGSAPAGIRAGGSELSFPMGSIGSRSVSAAVPLLRAPPADAALGAAVADHREDGGPLPLCARVLGIFAVDEPFAPGVRIRDLVKGGPAAVGGLKVGEYICSVNQAPIRTVEQLLASLNVIMAGTTVRIGRVRASGGPREVVEVVANSKRFL